MTCIINLQILHYIIIEFATSMKFYSIWTKLFTFGLKKYKQNEMNQKLEIWTSIGNENDKYLKEYLEIQVSII